MASGYARELPSHKRGGTYENSPPAYTSYQSQAGVPIASSVITLNDNTTVIEMFVIGTSGTGGIIGKWGSASVTSTNFDFAIPSGAMRTLVVPVSVMGTASVAGANVTNGLYQTVAVKTATAQSASVFSVEY